MLISLTKMSATKIHDKKIETEHVLSPAGGETEYLILHVRVTKRLCRYYYSNYLTIWF